MHRIRRTLPVLLSLAVAPAVGAQAAPAGTDIYLAPLTARGGMLAVGAARNATSRPGYDNQPAFLRDGSGFLYTSIRDDGQADIYRYDMRSGTVTRVTETPESEYSPTPMAGGVEFSAVRVERDSTQRLWRFPVAGGAPSLVLEGVKPVGYHAWIDELTLALFVLGEPATLQIASTGTGGATTWVHDIGRGLQAIPGDRGVTYAKRAGDTVYVEELRFLDAKTTSRRRLSRALKGQEFFAYTPTGELLAASGTTLYRWSRSCGENDGWEKIGDVAAAGARNVTRLAVSPDGRWLAFVAEPAG